MHSFGPFLHYKIQMCSKESYTIVLYTPIVFREMKVLLHYELQLHLKKSKYYCIGKWVQRKKLLLWYELYTSESNGEYCCDTNYMQVKKMNQNKRGEGSSPSQSYILFTNVTSVVSKKILYIIYKIYYVFILFEKIILWTYWRIPCSGHKITKTVVWPV